EGNIFYGSDFAGRTSTKDRFAERENLSQVADFEKSHMRIVAFCETAPPSRSLQRPRYTVDRSPLGKSPLPARNLVFAAANARAALRSQKRRAVLGNEIELPGPA